MTDPGLGSNKTQVQPTHASLVTVVPLFCITVFSSAFLLFQVQPVVGKFILPWFGSSPGVWATCLLFFQLLLLLGYGYAHLLVMRLTPKQQAILHCTLLVVAAVALPITPDPSLKPVDEICQLLASCWSLP